MSWSERSVRDHRLSTDCAIHQAYAGLALYPSVLEAFDETLHCVRKRESRLFEAPIIQGRHLGVDALVNLSRFRSAHARLAIDWAGTTSSWQPTVASLAHHLISRYNVPMFLSSAWYASDPDGDKKRWWFVRHSGGASFRSLDLPIEMTRSMEHAFLASHDHLSIEYAMRMAELLALRMPPDFVEAIMSTGLATDLRNGEFWCTVWLFLIANAGCVDPAQIGPTIDYIQAARHDRITVATPDGLMEFDPPYPEFSMKGRTVHSLQRLMQAWHRSLGVAGPGLSCGQSPFKPMILDETRGDSSESPRRWHMMELTNRAQLRSDRAQLRSEGAALHHCVASYANQCCRGKSSIWSLRLLQDERIHHVLTVEVNPERRTVVQARGKANHLASGRPLGLPQDWAAREGIRMAV